MVYGIAKIFNLFVVGILLSVSLSQFLMIDSTDSHLYINDTYVCYDFCQDLIFSASKYHIYLDYIYVPEKNHMMVGLYNPLEHSIEIIEPQTDEIIEYVKEDNENYIRIPVWNDCYYYSNVKIA